MNKILLLCASLFISVASHAAPIQLQLDGQLGDQVLSVHAGYQDAPFTGFIEFDLASPTNISGAKRYALSAWSILVTGTSGSMLLEGSGETHDEGFLQLSYSSDQLVLILDEDIDNPGTAAVEDTTMQLYFDTGIDLTSSSVFEDIDLGALFFDSPSSLLQFSTSQIPMQVASASLTAVPVPAAAWLFVSALAGLGVVKRRRG